MHRRPQQDRDEEIVRYIEKGIRQTVLAERYGTCVQNISRIWRQHLAALDERLPSTYWRKLGLSPRAANCLVNECINTLEDLWRCDKANLARAPNVGAVAMVEYYELLESYGRDMAARANREHNRLKREGHRRRKEDNEQAAQEIEGWVRGGGGLP